MMWDLEEVMMILLTNLQYMLLIIVVSFNLRRSHKKNEVNYNHTHSSTHHSYLLYHYYLLL